MPRFADGANGGLIEQGQGEGVMASTCSTRPVS